MKTKYINPKARIRFRVDSWPALSTMYLDYLVPLKLPGFKFLGVRIWIWRNVGSTGFNAVKDTPVDIDRNVKYIQSKRKERCVERRNYIALKRYARQHFFNQ